MRRKSDLYLPLFFSCAKVFHWALAKHFNLMLKGRPNRWYVTEYYLPQLVKIGKLAARYYKEN